jgi:hypothetical protein
MPKANLPVGAGAPLEAPQLGAATAVQERRVSEQLIADWERESRRLGELVALMTLDASAMKDPKWAHRFLIAVNPVIEDSSFVLYGASFAALLELPEIPNHTVSLAAQLPTRYVRVFTRGCIAATFSSVPFRMQGAVERNDGQQELYRAAFIHLSLDASPRGRHFTLGAFSCR